MLLAAFELRVQFSEVSVVYYPNSYVVTHCIVSQ